MQTFLKPLTVEEEKEYLEKYQKGDQDARNMLISHNLRLVAHMIKKYQGLENELDDLISIGTIGLIKAVSTYDMTKGIRLATYAARCIDNELLMMLRSRKKHSKEVSLYEPVGTDHDGNDIHLVDVLDGNDEDMTEHFIAEEEVRRLNEVIREVLTPLELEVIKLRYGLFGENELTQRVIGKRLGISRSYVSRIEKNAILKLRNSFFAS